ncbi:MAG: DNA polymerase III subunit [Dehalococcoidia bacterium]|nr:DNA polymerase III subunit [Dehalococcoidia bacterium]
MLPIIGHELAVGRLSMALFKSSLGHAYLIRGRPSIGKMTLALTLAQALNCRQQEAPCGVCPTCQRIVVGSHPDVQVVALGDVTDDKSNSRTEISIKQVRDVIQHWANLPAFEGGYRVFIIGGAEMLSHEAANCLLKTLEEPPEKVIFLLLSSEPSRLPETVISRCQRLDLKPVVAAKIEKALLARGCKEEKSFLLSRLSRGCPGWALEAAEDDSVMERRKEHMGGLLELLSSNLEARFEFAEDLSARFAKKRAEVQERIDVLLGIWRDLLMLKVGMSSEINNLDCKDSMQLLAGKFDIRGIRKGIDAVNDASKQLRRNANPRLVLEIMMLDMPVAGLIKIKA